MRNNSAKPIQTFNGLRMIAGQSALDLLNTVKYRGEVDNGDRFNTFSDIVQWALLADIINDKECKILDNQKDNSKHVTLFDQLCEFREHFRIILTPESNEKKQVEKSIQSIENTIAQLRPSIKINASTSSLQKIYPINNSSDLKSRIVACVSDLLENRESHTIKQCSGTDCDWLFADVTKAKRRKWCDTKTCGNLARVRKHRGQ